MRRVSRKHGISLTIWVFFFAWLTVITNLCYVGQIEYIFSDKTGTLTRNVMEYRKCTIGGKIYGGFQSGGDRAHPVIDKNTKQTPEEHFLVEMAKIYDNPYCSEKFTFVDPNFVKDLSDPSTEQYSIIKEFFTHLAVCHTVLADYQDEEDDFDIVYKAQSPDEAALVTTAKDLGFTFIDRVSDEISVNVLGKVLKLKILNIIEFNSTRKRMTVITRTSEGNIILYIKGADTVIYERLNDRQEQLQQLTLDHLEDFAQEGML